MLRKGCLKRIQTACIATRAVNLPAPTSATAFGITLRQLSSRSNIIYSVNDLQSQIYGAPSEDGFPLSLPEKEAGLCVTGKRRYLWTDSFGVANYLSQAVLSAKQGQTEARNHYMKCALRLIDCIITGLGQPRSKFQPMAVRRLSNGGYMGEGLGEYKGLRSGKLRDAAGATRTAQGNTYDGMYCHYLNKFLFVMLRYAKLSGDMTYRDNALIMANELHEAFFVPGRGYHMQLNVDLSPLSGRQVHPSHGAVQAWVIFNILRSMGGHVERQIEDLEPIVASYFSRPLRSDSFLNQFSDPLGLGQHLWVMQWLGDEACGVKLDPYKSTVYHRAQMLLPRVFEKHELVAEAEAHPDRATLYLNSLKPAVSNSERFPAAVANVVAAGAADAHQEEQDHHDDNIRWNSNSSTTTNSTTASTPSGAPNRTTYNSSSGSSIHDHRPRNQPFVAHELSSADAFRLYGALLGAQLTAEEGLQALSQPMVERALEVYPQRRHLFAAADKLAINTVMLASTLNYSAFRRADGEYCF